MNLTAPSEVKSLLSKLGLRPSKVLGQNFLIDVNILKILLRAADLHQEDAVLEVGPGLGVLTEWLLRWSGRVVAVEKDAKLFDYLAGRFRGVAALELLRGDILEMDLGPVFAAGVNKLVANLPYAVASRMLVNVVESAHPPERIVVTVQREVAERLAARPGTKDYGLLTVLAQLRYNVSLRKEVSPTCFFPPPDVVSAIVVMARRNAEEPGPPIPPGLKDLLKAAFSRRRKQLATTLQHALPHRTPEDVKKALGRLGVDPRARPEDLSPENWSRLWDEVGKVNG